MENRVELKGAGEGTRERDGATSVEGWVPNAFKARPVGDGTPVSKFVETRILCG